MSISDEEKRAIRQRPFPLQPADRGYARAAAPLKIPWSVAEKAYGVYASRYGTYQSLERLAQRGGFAVEEMDELYPLWRDEASEIDRLREALRSILRVLRLDGDKSVAADLAYAVAHDALYPPDAHAPAAAKEGSTHG